jgi:hypothetical protein
MTAEAISHGSTGMKTVRSISISEPPRRSRVCAAIIRKFSALAAMKTPNTATA